MTSLAVALDPTVRRAKAGTEHEGHDGWGMRGGDPPGTYRCEGCFGDITALVLAQVERESA